MNEHPLDDLISAYVDGELSPAETAEVEKLLADSAEARQLLEEFRALGASLRALPKLQLGPDFQERVLRQAERAALAGDALSPPAADLPTVAASETISRFPRSWQSWKWASLATAAALMIWVVGRGGLEDKRQVAIAPASKPVPATPLPEASFKAIKTKEAETAPADNLADSEAPAVHSDMLEATEPARDEAGAVPERLGRGVPMLGQTFNEAPSAAAASDLADSSPANTQKPVELGIDVSPAADAAQLLTDEAKDTSPQPPPAEPAPAAARFVQSAPMAAEASAVANEPATPVAPPSEVVTIDVVAARPESASVALGEALLRNSIVLETQPGEMSVSNSARGGAGLNSVSGAEFAEPRTLAAGAPLAANGAAAATQLGVDPSQSQLYAALPADAGKGQEVWLYYVEASEGQLQKTIEDLRSQPQTFFSVLPVEVPADQRAQQEALVAAVQAADVKKSDADAVQEMRELDRVATPEKSESLAGDQPAVDSFDANAQMRLRESSVAGAGGAEGSAGVAGAVELKVGTPVDARQLSEPVIPQQQGLGRDQKAQAVQTPSLQPYGGQQGRAYRVGVGQSQAEPGPRGDTPGYGMRDFSYGRQRMRYGYGAQQSNPRGGAGYGQPAQAATPLRRKQMADEQAQAARGPEAPAATEPPLAKADGAADPQRTVRALILLRSADPAGEAVAVPAAAAPQPEAARQPAAEPLKAAAPQ
jgi:anti-sigma factor RsiW